MIISLVNGSNTHFPIIISGSGSSASGYTINDPYDGQVKSLGSYMSSGWSANGLRVYGGTPWCQGGGSCSAPSLSDPGDEATLSSRTITFRWNAVSGCTFNGYTFRIKNTSDMDSGGTTLIDTGEGGMQRTETINGWDNQDLYWGVKATNAPNGASWAVRRFRINPQSSSGSWRAEYYDSQDMWWNPNNTNWHSCGEDLSGPTLDKNYGTSAPCSGMRNNGDQWVGDYRGRITFSPGTYVFYSDHDDGARLWVEGLNNNNPIMEAGGSGSTTVCNGPTGYYLDGGKNIRVVLREEGGDARIKLWWDTNTATCLPKCYSLNTSANPSGSGWIGLDPQPNCAGGYTDGTNVQLTASPYSGYTFLNWTGKLTGTANPGSITINYSKTVTANFSGCYMLTRTHSGSGSDPTASPATPPDCSAGQYVAGEAISLTASPANGWRVASWSGTSNNSSTSTSNSLTMPASNHTVGVNYEAIPPTCYTLTCTHTGSGSDPVASPSNSNGCSAGQYVAGASISLTASPASGWRVGSWSGTDNDSSTSTTNSLTMPASNRTVTANYAEIPSGDTTPPNGRITSPSNNATVTACPLQIVAEANDTGSGVAGCGSGPTMTVPGTRSSPIIRERMAGLRLGIVPRSATNKLLLPRGWKIVQVIKFGTREVIQTSRWIQRYCRRVAR